MKLIDYPTYVPLEGYQKAIDEMVSLLAQYPGVITVFQVGGLSSPGISDIDFFVVFEDDVRCNQQPLSQISPESRYLFTHGLFGTSKQHACRLEQYTLFKNYRKLWGDDFDVKAEYEAPTKELLTQMAMEYLFKMYLTLQIENTYRISGVRNFLLLAKAIEYDLDLLDIENGQLRSLCNEVLQIRDEWFTSHPSKHKLQEFIASFDIAIQAFFKEMIKHHALYLPAYMNPKIARNMKVQYGENTGTSIAGLPLFPNLGAFLIGKKYPKLLNRITEFTFIVPYKSIDMPVQIERRFDAVKKATDYNREFLPNFSCTGFPLNIM